MNSAAKLFANIFMRSSDFSSYRCASVFMKPQKKMDPEVAKIREMRKRRKLEREIRQIKKHSKKPKPVEEMTIDIISAKNISERYRAPVKLPEEVEDERAVVYKNYQRSRNALFQADLRWLRAALMHQESALDALKALNLQLYEAAVQPDEHFSTVITIGPSLTPPLNDYECPDGEYVNTTRSWV